VVYVFAAGNDNSDLSGFVPAAYDEVLGRHPPWPTSTGNRAAARHQHAEAMLTKRRPISALFAASGSPDANHTIAAPGVCILSTVEGRRLQHHLRHQHGIAPRGGYGRTVHRQRKLPRRTQRSD